MLFMRKRVPTTEIGETLGQLIPGAYGHAMKTGAPLAGRPFCRYRDVNQAEMTLEAGVAVAAATAGEGDVLAGTLPAGSVVTTIHSGPYDRLNEAYEALAEWMREQGLKPAGDLWEAYITDSGEEPDPVNWKTEVN